MSCVTYYLGHGLGPRNMVSEMKLTGSLASYLTEKVGERVWRVGSLGRL